MRFSPLVASRPLSSLTRTRDTCPSLLPCPSTNQPIDISQAQRKVKGLPKSKFADDGDVEDEVYILTSDESEFGYDDVGHDEEDDYVDGEEGAAYDSDNLDDDDVVGSIPWLFREGMGTD